MLFGKKNNSAGTQMSSVEQNLYKQNLELSIKNKTLSILEKLYEISIQSLTPAELAHQIGETIQRDFDFERVGILSYDTDDDLSELLAHSESDRFHEARAVADNFFNNIRLEHVTRNAFFGPIFERRQMGYTENLKDAWGEGVTDEQVQEIQNKSKARSIIAYPLTNQAAVIGFFVITLDRTYAELGEYEKESIHSFSNVISVALDKARLYQELTVTNEKLEEANEQLKELDRLKSEFLSVASHQLRAPTTAIKGYIANVLESSYGEVPEYLKEPLGVVQEATRVMASSIEDYLNVSRIEQGRMKYDMSVVDATKLARSATEELQPLAAKKGITLSFVEAPEISIQADSGKIKQVFTNLIDNAIKYTEVGSVTVSVEVKKGKKIFRFMTLDTGIGIPADEIDKLFEKFTRARGANSVNTTGTGLGLYVAKELVEGHHGTIHIESEGSGKGSKFIVEIPLIQPTS